MSREGETTYDLAFSFLAQDEEVARQIADELRGRWNVFIYSERQKEIGGKDGVEKFSAVFRREARLCVVLYRDGWGRTKWTGVEQTAIRERFYECGSWDFLVVVLLDESGTQPAWLPKTKMWAGLKTFGLAATAAVIDARAQEGGGEPHPETAESLARHAASILAIKRQREQFRQSEHGVATAQQEVEKLRNELAALVGRIAVELPGIAIPPSRQRWSWLVNGPGAHLSLAWSCTCINSLTDSALVVQEFAHDNSWPTFAENRYVPNSEFDIHFTVDNEGNPAWQSDDDPSNRFLTTPELADHLMKRLIRQCTSE